MQKIPAFVAIDLETTGLDFEKDEIIEVALVRFEDGVPTESTDYLVKPSSAELRPFIENLTGIKKEDLESVEGFGDLAGKICSFIGNLPLVAHNAAFDSRFLKGALAKVGVNFDDHPVWDSLTLSRIAYQNIPNHRLDTLTQELNIERSRAHRALPDADACGRLFVMCFQKICESDAWLGEALLKIGEGSDWQALFSSFENSTNGVKPQYALPDVSAAGALPKVMVPRVSEFFKENGFLSQVVEGFQVRKTQQDFAGIVERNMHKGGLCVMEAPTGSGKSMAYLVAAANKAASGERVVISTATRALQEQLWANEIPKLSMIYNGSLIPAILKGRDNYLCLRKFEEVLKAPQNLLLPEERDSFMALLPWVYTTQTGDINECHSFSAGRNRVLWSKISSNASSCFNEQCPYFSKCPGLCAKRKAMAANLLLVNHSLFLADLSLEFALLPAYEHIVFDEAHRLPAISSQAFGRSVSFFRYRNVAKILVPSKNERNGLLVEVQNSLSTEDAENRDVVEQLIVALNEMEKSLHRFFMKIGKKLTKQKQGKSGFVYTNGVLADYETDPNSVIEQYQSIKKLLERLWSHLDGNTLLKSVSGHISEIERFMADFEFLVKAGRKDWVFYLEEPFNPHTLKMHAYPLYAGGLWSEKFYPWIKSATFTSATLAVQGSLDYFVQTMGMNHVTRTKIPFLRVYADESNHEGRRSIMIAKYLPKPSVPEYNESLQNLLVEVLPEVDENTMVLFTSISAMMKAQQVLAPAFAAKNKLLLCQHVDGALDGLVSMFRKERGACLLGCQSLWEGVDFPGDALKFLVIPKLPFPNPSEPLVAGISNQLKEAGKNAFKEYFVPEAFMELRQGLGRLLRGEEDTGKVLILDNRVLLEHYGKSFQKIWNFKHKTAFSLEDVKKFMK